MVTLSLHSPAVTRLQGPAHPSRIAAFLRSLPGEWRARRAARSADALSDEMLHDIGLTRGEIETAVRFGRKPRR